MTIKYIIFDVGNVIVNANHAVTHRILQGYGVPEDRAKLFFQYEEYKEFSRGKINEQQFYDALINKYLQTQLTFEQVVHAHDEHLYGINKEVVEVIKRIPAQNVAFLTDTNAWQTQRERNLIDLRRYSDKIYRSHEIHMLKIDDGCFPYVRDQLEVKPDELLLVDDSLEKMVKAQEDGWQAIQFQNSEQLIADLK